MLYVFLLIAIVFVVVAVLCAFATFSRSPTLRRTATRAIYGSLAAALISAALAVWFFHRQRAIAPSPPMSLGIADKPSDDHFLPMIDARDLTEVMEHFGPRLEPADGR
jgi:uncharacterized PurR-regulated membrane protein YhhQ (DUF165 family)